MSNPLEVQYQLPLRPQDRQFVDSSSADRFSDRARLSTAGYLGNVVNVLESSRCRSRCSTQSEPPPQGQRRCTHWSDGAESHANARALMRSSPNRLHPDHRLHLNESRHYQPWILFSPTWRSCSDLLRTPSKHRAVGPHSLQDDGELACYRDHRPAIATRLGQSHAPGL